MDFLAGAAFFDVVVVDILQIGQGRMAGEYIAVGRGELFHWGCRDLKRVVDRGGDPL